VTQNSARILAYSPLGAVMPSPSEYQSNTVVYWSPACLAAPQKYFRRRLYNFLCFKLQDHLTESHQISIKCVEMIANYYAETKIAIFQSVSESQGDE